MARSALGVVTAAVTLLSGGVAHAQAGSWYVQAGPAQVTLEDDVTMAMGGSPVPGAGIESDSQLTLEVEIGRFITNNWAVSFAGGYPPTADVDFGGSLAGAGYLGSITYGPMALTASYHFNPMGTISPYLGAGVSYMHVFDTDDGLLQDLDVDDTYGPIIQAGVQVMVTPRVGAFFDVKQAYFDTDASGLYLGSVPATANVTLDPLVINTGLVWRF